MQQIIIELLRLLTIVIPSFLIAQFIFPPVNRLREIRRRISHALTFYANTYPVRQHINPDDNQKILDDTSSKIRGLAAELRAARDNVPLYRLLAKTRFIPTWEESENAATGLIGWSNYIYEDGMEGSQGRAQFRKTISKALNIPRI